MALATGTTADQLRDRGRDGIARARDILERVERGDAGDVLEAFNDLLIALANVELEAALLREVHPDAAVREAAEALQRDAAVFRVDAHQSRALHAALRAIDARALDAQAARFRELALRDMRRAGVELPDADRTRARALRGEVVRLGQDYARTIRNDVRTLELDPADLEGLPPDYLAARTLPSGRIRITTDPPDTTPVLLYARSARARRAVLEAMGQRAPENLETFSRLRAKRYALARVLGHPAWADFNLEDKMTGSPAVARAFLERLIEIGAPRLEDELAELLAAKRADIPDEAWIEPWDLQHYQQRVRQTRFRYDSQEARPYFEYRRVRQAILDLNAELFDLAFTPVTLPDRWHDAVETFEVRVRGELRGYISLDMHPRAGKNKWFYCTTKVPGIADRQLHHGVLICNFPDPSMVKGPALMEHQQVVTFFHEFGHLVHGIAAGKARWIRLMRPAENDIMEAPSRFHEEYIFDHDVLTRFARHVETGAVIPRELVERMREARDFGRGWRIRSGAFMSLLALDLHTGDPAGTDARQMARELRERLVPERQLESSNFPATWEHMSNEAYSAAYYTYLWSDVIARDLYTRFTRGLLDAVEARRYFELLLGQGGTKPAAELVADFLGRPYSFDAFERWLRGT